MCKSPVLRPLASCYDPGRKKKRPSKGGLVMPRGTRKRFALSGAALASISVIAFIATAPAADYKPTVNKERLLNAQNEPQNWLLMNGDYASSRYSKLTQINRDNVKNFHLTWPLALAAIHDLAQTGP